MLYPNRLLDRVSKVMESDRFGKSEIVLVPLRQGAKEPLELLFCKKNLTVIINRKYKVESYILFCMSLKVFDS